MRKALLVFLLSTLLVSASAAQLPALPSGGETAAPPAASKSSTDTEGSTKVKTGRRSRLRRLKPRRAANPAGRQHYGISQREAIFLVAIVGSCMGIGALAGGAKGLAIGALVGGWGAFVAHKLIKW